MATIQRTIVILQLAAPDQDRKVYAVHRATGTRTKHWPDYLAIGDQVAAITVPYRETIDYRALAALYATADWPVWEGL